MDGGQYYTGAIADSYNYIVESDETNNTGVSATTITITRLYADLLVTSVEATPATSRPATP